MRVRKRPSSRRAPPPNCACAAPSCAQASLELQREVQLLVGAYAGLYGTGTDSATATAAAPGGGSRGGSGAAAGGAGGAAAVTSGGGAAGPAVQRAALAAEQQLAALRRARRGQVLKEAAVAREKMRELEARPGPPLPVHYGVVLLPPPYGPGLASGGRGGAQVRGASWPCVAV